MNNDAIRVGFIGPPGSKKTTVALLVSGALKARGYNVGYVPEFAREAKEQFGANFCDQPWFMIEQMQREIRALKIYDIVITDTALGLSLIYERLNMASRTFPNGEPGSPHYWRFRSLEGLVHAWDYDLLFQMPPRACAPDGVRPESHLRGTEEIEALIGEVLPLHTLSRRFGCDDTIQEIAKTVEGAIINYIALYRQGLSQEGDSSAL